MIPQTRGRCATRRPAAGTNLIGPSRCDDVPVMRQQPWCSIAVKSLDRDDYGRTQWAWEHRTEPALLLLHRPRSRGGRWADRIGIWCLIHGGVLVRRRSASGRRVRGVPWRWANQTLKAHLGPAAGQKCHLTDGRRPSVAESIHTMPVCPDELPPVLSGHHRHGGRAVPITDIDDGPIVPFALPLVPPERTLAGRYADHVLTREEHLLYVEQWRGWMADHPEYNTPDGRAGVHAMCMADVRLARIELVSGRTAEPRTCGLLQRAYLHLQRQRIAMGATRRQRLDYLCTR
jgi:hypothetical protein